MAEEGRWEVVEGPLRRAMTARWLWLSPLTLRTAVLHANQLLREFAWTGPGGSEAACTLLSMLPLELEIALSQSVAVGGAPLPLEAFVRRSLTLGG